MKKCFKCGVVKPLSEFYKHKGMKDGRLNKCKECNKKDVSKNYHENKDYYSAYDQERNQVRKDYIRGNNKKWQEKHPDRVRDIKREWAERNRDKKQAQTMVGNAIRDGYLTKGVCQICGSKDVQAHHYDYSKPLKVIWLCVEHHSKVHWWLRWNKRKYK